MRTEKRPRFYGWYIAGCCLVVFFFTNGLSLYVPQNLFPRFMETFGATPAEVSRTTAITFALAGFIAPFVGAAIDRLGVVRVIRTGLIVLALTFTCLSLCAEPAATLCAACGHRRRPGVLPA